MQCGVPNRSDRNYCSNCGSALPIPCTACDFSNELGELFCGGCGTRLAAAEPISHDATAERRHITVLFADAAGFTSLSEHLDPETVREMIGACFELLSSLVQRHGGTIALFTGDGIMALFGSPLSEDHADRALACALDIQRGMVTFSQSARDRWGV